MMFIFFLAEACLTVHLLVGEVTPGMEQTLDLQQVKHLQIGRWSFFFIFAVKVNLHGNTPSNKPVEKLKTTKSVCNQGLIIHRFCYSEFLSMFTLQGTDLKKLSSLSPSPNQKSQANFIVIGRYTATHHPKLFKADKM